MESSVNLLLHAAMLQAQLPSFFLCTKARKCGLGMRQWFYLVCSLYLATALKKLATLTNSVGALVCELEDGGRLVLPIRLPHLNLDRDLTGRKGTHDEKQS